jgi:hypothetical protein
MRKAYFLTVAALSLWSAVGQAADTTNFALKTTEDLYRVCSTPANDPQHSEAIHFCEGYLLGVVTYHDAVTERENLKRLICYPPTVTRDQGTQAFIDWAAHHQTDNKFMNDPPVVGAVRGLAAKWPCKQN